MFQEKKILYIIRKTVSQVNKCPRHLKGMFCPYRRANGNRKRLKKIISLHDLWNSVEYCFMFFFTTSLYTANFFSLFPAGHRVCLGEQMARVELFIFFTNLLRAFTFQLPEGVKEINMEYILGAILQPHPYQLRAIPR